MFALIAVLLATKVAPPRPPAPPPPLPAKSTGVASVELDREHLSARLNEENGCPEDGAPPEIATLLYADFTGDGHDEAVIVASTCNAGTHGPDVHAVYSADKGGEPVELPIEAPKPDGLFGASNSDFTIEKGRLVQTWTDTSGRKAPFQAVYRQVKGHFEVETRKIAPAFATSYDCTKTSVLVELAICHVESLAALDRTLDAKYRDLTTNFTVGDKLAVQAEQVDFRDKRAAVVVDRYWVDELTALYLARIAALDARAAQRKL